MAESVGMDLDDARNYLKEHSHAVLSTVRKDGTPQMSPVLVALEENGRVAISSRETAYKVRNLQRDPRAWLCVFPDGFYGEWIQIEGSAEIVSLPDALEPLVDYYRTLSGEHPDWDDYRQTMRDQQRCVIRVDLLRAGPNRAG